MIEWSNVRRWTAPSGLIWGMVGYAQVHTILVAHAAADLLARAECGQPASLPNCLGIPSAEILGWEHVQRWVGAPAERFGQHLWQRRQVGAYQFRPKDAVQSLFNHPEGGACVNYSGCLIENVNSLAQAGQWGYYNGWNNDFTTARNWTTSGGNRRMDITAFGFHHVLAPLVSPEVLRKEIQMHKHIYESTFGPGYSKGFWPAECSFSERIIPVLVEEGLEWSVIANSHLAGP